MRVLPGEIYRHDAFYVAETGELEAKYLLVLATPAKGDIVARLLTSRAHGRPEMPRCFHGAPYGGFFLGVPGAPLLKKTWVDLRYLDDLDADDFRRREAKGKLVRVATLPREVLPDVLLCVAAADDTTPHQERHLRDALAALR